MKITSVVMFATFQDRPALRSLDVKEIILRKINDYINARAFYCIYNTASSIGKFKIFLYDTASNAATNIYMQ